MLLRDPSRQSSAKSDDAKPAQDDRLLMAQEDSDTCLDSCLPQYVG